MPKFAVEVIRMEERTAIIEVVAEDSVEAEQLAEDEASKLEGAGGFWDSPSLTYSSNKANELP